MEYVWLARNFSFNSFHFILLRGTLEESTHSYAVPLSLEHVHSFSLASQVPLHIFFQYSTQMAGKMVWHKKGLIATEQILVVIKRDECSEPCMNFVKIVVLLVGTL